MADGEGRPILFGFDFRVPDLWPPSAMRDVKGTFSGKETMNSPQYFEITYRGVTAQVEPANGDHRWEYRLDCDEDWKSLGIGSYPAVSIDTARAKAIEAVKSKRPEILAGLYRERDSIQKRITALEAV